jgi:hypothetical protein
MASELRIMIKLNRTNLNGDYIMAKRGQKTATTISVMEANRGKSYDEIGTLIAEALGAQNGTGRLYYRYMVEAGKVQGFPAPWMDGTATKAPKAKAVKATVKRMAKEVISKSKRSVTATVKSVDEIEAIKQKNLETMRAVSAKLSRVRDFSKPVKEEEVKDGEYSPHLDREEELNVLRSEGLIDQVPQYSHLEG